ncbi:sensor histidine kinase [Paenibacillus sp. alder61]|uniref:sensor histidine kinase n=1 Tax=Paenibacillus sp. alder61 TaxID=2862948 RepID=UPI001CD5EAFA|nr:HAMP domain-containing sensor histidine kinase [Paenibacillus sp. alder61]
MMKQADLYELSFRETLAMQDRTAAEEPAEEVARIALERLKSAGQEVRIYDSSEKLLGWAVDGIVINDGTPLVFQGNIQNAIKGNYAYTITDAKLLYFTVPIQDKYYQNSFVFEFVEDLSYFYVMMDQIRYILLAGAVGFLFLITLASLFIARNTTKPIKYLLGATEKFSKQQFQQVNLNRKDELGMLAAGLNRMGIQLNEYIQHQKQFVSNVSHELKTPLAAIRGFSQYLYEEENEDKELQKIYAHLVNESDRLTLLINELLLLSRFDKAGSDEMGKEKTDLTVLTERVAAEMRAKAEDQDILLDFKPGKPVFACVNPTLMSHAAANIVDNALKYSQGGTQVRIETFIRQETAVIQIRDEGVGIREDEIARVQERFYRAENAHVAKGSGLGLSMCKEIVEKFDGKLEIESEVGVGTTVSILLPLA